jgi:hypothetical protein
METSAVDTSFNLKGAFEQATQGGVTVGGNLDAKYKDIISNASFTALALGGGAETPAQIFRRGCRVGTHRLAGIHPDRRFVSPRQSRAAGRIHRSLSQGRSICTDGIHH